MVDVVLQRYGPPVTLPNAPWLLDARGGVKEAIRDLLGLDDAELARRWWWREEREGEAEVRYAFYRAIEALERSAAEVGRMVPPRGVPAGAGPFALATIARWDLHGVLAPLSNPDLDADPGGGEWTIRQTLAHTVNVQRAYPAFAAWWLSREQTPELPASIPDEVGAGFPAEEDDGAGSLEDIRGRLDEAMDGAAERMASLDHAQLATPARWSGYAVDVGFRLGRMSSHLQEHTVQVEKTLAMLGRAPSEVERLTRLVLRAFGRLEACIFGTPATVSELGQRSIITAVDELAAAAKHVRQAGSVTDFEVP